MKKLEMNQMESRNGGTAGCGDEFAGISTAAGIIALATGGLGILAVSVGAAFAAVLCEG